MRIEQLRYLVATVDTGTMTAGAAVCHVTQPALTRAVRALEEELGSQLLRRRGNRLEPTEAGERVLVLARRIVADADTIAAVANDDVVRVRATPSQEREIVRAAVARLLRQSGRRVLVTTSPSADAVFDAVADGHADVGVCDHVDQSSLPGEVLGWQETLLVCPGHWDVPDPMPAEMLHDLPIVAPAPGSARRARMDAGLAALGIRPNVTAVTDQDDLGVPLVARGVVAAFSYAATAADAAQRGARVVHLDPAVRRPVGWVRRPGRLSPSARAFVGALRAEAPATLDVS